MHADHTGDGNTLVALHRPETGGGQASLWTAAAAPDHRLWTTLRGPVDPSRLPTCPHPRRRQRASRKLSITTNQRRDAPSTLLQPPVAELALVNIERPQTGGPFPSIKVGHTGLSKTDGSPNRGTGDCSPPTVVPRPPDGDITHDAVQPGADLARAVEPPPIRRTLSHRDPH